MEFDPNDPVAVENAIAEVLAPLKARLAELDDLVRERARLHDMVANLEIAVSRAGQARAEHQRNQPANPSPAPSGG